MQHVTTLIQAVMRSRTLRILLIPAMFTGVTVAQDITGTYQMVGVHVGYTEVARDSVSAADSIGTYAVTASWPSSAGAAYTHTLKSYAIDDTIATFETPSVMQSAAGLAAIGMNLNLALTISSLIIPGVQNDITTYPTTSTVDCSTGAVIAPVTDNAITTMVSTTNSDVTTGQFTWGFGITQSDVFDWFEAPSDWEDPGTYGENWGKLTGYFWEENSSQTFDTLKVYWRAIDGLGADAGLDTEYKQDRHLGIPTVPGDTVTIAYLAATVAVDSGVTINLPSAGVGMFGGKGADGVDDTGDEVDLNNGYIFDPVGDDGIPFNGDEPLQFTGYYFTYNMVLVGSTFPKALGASLGEGNTLHFADSAAVDTTLRILGAVPALAAVAAGMVADSVDAWIAAGLTSDVALEKAPVFAMGVALAVDAALQTGFDPDDSDHDYVGTDGRLIFEIDNRCIPTTQTREVSATFVNVEVLGIESDLSTVPAKFVVHANYPNPFNPSTTIGFELPAQLITEVTVWNLLGQQVRTIYSGELMAGRHEVKFNGRDDQGLALPSGVYFYRVQAGQFNSTRKFMLLK